MSIDTNFEYHQTTFNFIIVCVTYLSKFYEFSN
nr:MAG TPA: hypothetical protein [Caudoviricetes sp.]